MAGNQECRLLQNGQPARSNWKRDQNEQQNTNTRVDRRAAESPTADRRPTAAPSRPELGSGGGFLGKLGVGVNAGLAAFALLALCLCCGVLCCYWQRNASSNEAFARMIEHDSNARPGAKKRRSVVMTSDTGNVARRDVVMRGSSFDLDQAFPARPSTIDMVRPGANSQLV